MKTLALIALSLLSVGCTNNIGTETVTEPKIVVTEKVVVVEVPTDTVIEKVIEKPVDRVIYVPEVVYQDKIIKEIEYVDRIVEREVETIVEEYEKEDSNGIRVEYWRKVNGIYDGLYYKRTSNRILCGRYKQGKKVGVWTEKVIESNGPSTGGLGF